MKRQSDNSITENLERRTKEDAMQMRQRTSGTSYDPVSQKPTKLGDRTTVPKIYYYGPPPDAGTTYGVYTCGGCGERVLSDMGDTRFCPGCGSQMKSVGKAIAPTTAKHDSVLTRVTGRISKMNATVSTCAKCKAQLVTTAPNKLTRCIVCSAELGEADDTVHGDSPVFESIVDPSDIGDSTVSSSDISMVLHDEDAEDPFWNIELKGRPLAQVRLSDQPRSEEVRKVFVDDRYAETLAKVVENVPLREILAQVRARYWAAVVDERGKIKEVRASVEQTVDNKVTEKFEDYKDRFLDCLALVSAGMDKNFFSDEGNKLKESFHDELGAIGIPEDQSTQIIEEAFCKGSEAFFVQLFDKASEYMALTPQAYTEVQKAIAGSDVIVPSGMYEPDTTLASHMARNNNLLTNASGPDAVNHQDLRQRAQDVRALYLDRKRR